MGRLLIIANAESVLAGLLRDSFPDCDTIHTDQIPHTDLNAYDAFAVLGGAQEKGIRLLTPMRKALDAQIARGKKVFAEFVRGIGQVSFLETESTRFSRPVLLHPCALTGDLARGVILDEQSNARLIVYKATNRSKPILQYERAPRGFYQVKDADGINAELSRFALWLEGENLLVCSFRLSNFSKAKFAPRRAWAELLTGLIRWLGGSVTQEAILRRFRDEYTLEEGGDIAAAADRAMDWFANADMLVQIDGTPYCVKEGLASDVYADGSHIIAEPVRDDCAGETALAFFLRSLWKNSESDARAARGLYRMPLDMQITEDCPHRGMVRGSVEGWWNVSYQDDTARGFLLPLMFYTLLSGDTQYMPRVCMALDYLLASTGTDGLRCARVDFYDQHDEAAEAGAWHAERADGSVLRWRRGGGLTGSNPLRAYAAVPSGLPSAHYNGFYMASLCFGFMLTGEARYLDVAEQGLRTIMNVYPYTAREHSETQEYCRLIMPLAMLFWASGDPEHKTWLYRVARDLQRFRHPGGGYVEWDTGYTADCAGVADGESSVLAENGDPIMDLLYSLNWLPIGFAVAYCITEDAWFKQLWEEICLFLSGIQIRSGNPLISGVWPRAFDADLREVYGVPNDVGWAPWSVESGWTMAEIASGMFLGLMEERVKPLFRARPAQSAGESGA